MSASIPQTQPVATKSMASPCGCFDHDGKFKGFTVPQILSWRNPQATGTLLAEALAFVTIFSSSLALRLFLKVSVWVIGVLSAVEFATRKINGPKGGLVSNYAPSRHLPINDECINTASQQIGDYIRKAVFGIQHVLDARNPAAGFRIAGVFYVVYIALGVFSSVKALLLTAIVLLFSLPALYLNFKQPVDDVLTCGYKQAHAHFTKVQGKACQTISPHIEKVRGVFGQRGGFPSHNGVAPLKDVPGSAAVPASTGATGATGVSTGASTGASIKPMSAPTTTMPTSVPASVLTPEEVAQYDSVPTLAGNVKVDQSLKDKFAGDAAKLRSSIEADKQGLN